LIAAPYSLTLGSTVDVKVIAYNIYGNSASSSVGNGATIVLVPSSPINLANNVTITSAT
jgi:hypothetical protein